MNKIIVVVFFFLNQLVYCQTNHTSIDGKSIRLGDSASVILSQFPEPFYKLINDSTKSHFHFIAQPRGHYRIAIVRQSTNDNSNSTLLAWLEFVENKLEGVTRSWYYDNDINSNSVVKILIDALKENFENDQWVKIEYSRNNDPTSESQSIEINNLASNVTIRFNKDVNNVSASISDEGGNSFSYDPFEHDYKKAYCLSFFDYAHLAGNNDVISELYNSISDAKERLKALDFLYLSTGQENPNSSIMTVVFPLDQDKTSFNHAQRRRMK
jgi:hypothetical protein